jgi:2-dehydropantoate 2-reductase
MRVAVIGVGGVGGYFGGKLAEGGVDVVFIARGRTLEALRSRGLRVDSVQGDFALPKVQATDDPVQAGKVDVVLIAVKAWQIPESIRNLAPMLHDTTAVIPLENGMTAPEDIAAALGRQHAMGGLCGIVSYIIEPGHIRHAAVDPFIQFGELDNSRSDRALRISESFKAAGVNAEVPPDIHRSMWTKFIFIAPYSAIGAASRAPIGVWRAIPETRALAGQLLRELLAVAQARGVALAPDAFELTMKRYDGLSPDATPSLQRDVMDGKPSELDAQLGAVVRMAREANVPVPRFESLYAALLPQERRARGEVTSPQ